MTNKNLRIVFMGTPGFAVSSLKALVENGYNVVGVITAPDKPAGRGKKLTESEVKKYAVKKELRILQPEKLKNPYFLNDLKSLNADLQIIVAFRMLPEAVWKMPPLGTFNLHASLLPQYRGAAPINWAIINGETKTGVTTFFLDHEIDTGKILYTKKINIGKNDTAGEIHDKLMKLGASLVLKTVDAIARKKINPVPQAEITIAETIQPAPKLYKEDCKIDWTKDCENVRNLIRGLSPYPAAWANLVHKESGRTILCKIHFAQPVISEESVTPGTIDSDGETYLNAACGNGWLEITKLQLSGKKQLNTPDFLRGFREIDKYRFE